MMTVSELINKANANGMHVKQSFKVLSKLDEHQQQLFIDGNCICCGNQAPAEGMWEYDHSDEGGVHGTCVGYEQELFCDGCEMHLPAEVLLDHEVISQAKFDELCSPTMSEEDRLRELYLSIHPDKSVSFYKWRKSLTEDLVREMRRQYGVDDDDDLPF